MSMKIKEIGVLSLVVASIGLWNSAIANEKLALVNDEVAEQSAAIDDKYGVLLDYQELNDLKLELIAIKALEQSEEGQTLEQIAAQAFADYEVEDESEQRKLLIKLDTQSTYQQKSTGHGQTPDYP